MSVAVDAGRIMPHRCKRSTFNFVNFLNEGLHAAGDLSPTLVVRALPIGGLTQGASSFHFVRV